MADIIETARSAGSFAKLYKLLDRADLVDKLKGSGPFTLFAPDDKAFERVGDDVVALLSQNVPNLRNVLLYHVLPGVYTLDDLASAEEIKTLQGDTVKIGSSGHDILINNARIVISDLEADNGVVHIVEDIVLSKVEAGV